MKKEFNLSDKICEVKIKDKKDEYWREVCFKEDVKEAVKLLKFNINKIKRQVVKEYCKDEEIDYWMNKMETPLIKEIDKIFGEKLK